MTTFNNAQKALGDGAAAIHNLADLAARVRALPDLPDRGRQDLLSALNTLARAAGKPLEALPAEPAPLRAILNGLVPTMAGVSEGRWRNIRSLLRRALSLAWPRCRADTPGKARSVAWQALVAGLPDFHARYRLARLAGHCSRAGIPPAAVDDTVLGGFLEALLADPLIKEPHRIHREAAIEWNRHAGVEPGWPGRPLAVPSRRQGFVLPPDAIIPSLAADIASWTARLAAGGDPLGDDDFRPLRATSIATRAGQVRTLVSAMVEAGVDPATLHGLADLVVPENVAAGLTVLMTRAGGKPTLHTGQLAALARIIAHRHVGAAAGQLAKLDRIRRRATPRAGGMTARNRERLRPFNDPRTRRAFLMLPEVVREEVRRAGQPTLARARLLRNAVAMAILSDDPIRLRNLLSLQLGANLLRGSDGRLTLVLEPHETKNDQVHEAPLPAATGRLIGLYMTNYQPLLCRRSCAWLFPNEAGEGPMSADGLRSALMDLVRDRLGLVVNPHLYRHIAANLILYIQPGAYGHVRLVLGHKSVNTTTSFYAGMETRPALQRYDEMVAGVRDGVPQAPRRRAGKGR